MEQAGQGRPTPITESSILAALPDTIAAHLGAPPYALKPLQENAYCLRSATRHLFVKVIAAGDRYGQNELAVNRRLGSSVDFPAPRLLFCETVDKTTIAGWEWASGTDLRHAGRSALPHAFAELGRFHSRRRSESPVASPTTHAPYPSVSAMLAAELASLTGGLPKVLAAPCARAFRLLEAGYVTTIHGDFHPGNIRVAGDQVQFVDWGYATTSLNLFDLGYVQRGREPDPEAWWQIGPAEAGAVLDAYFTECGLGDLDWQPLQWAVEVWSTLYAYHNASERQNEEGMAASLEALHILLAGK